MTRSAPRKLVLIDGNSLVYRAFYALPPLTNAEGESTGAAYGFTTMLFKLLEEERPEMVGVAFDLPAPTFRHADYAEYKAGRKETPESLRPQLALVRELLAAMHIPSYDHAGYEADDVIATLATRAEAAGHRVLIVSGDLDELQLVSARVSAMVPRRGLSDTQVYDVAAVEERYGLPPEKLPDFRALRGDASDNIPGVPGVGEKTAAALIQKYGSLEELLARVEEVTPPRISQALAAHAPLAEQAKRLSLLACDLPIAFNEEELQLREPDRPRLLEIFRRLDFRSLAERFAAEQEVAGEFRLLTTPAEVEAFAAELAGLKEVIVHPISEGGPGMQAAWFGVAFLVGDTAVVVAGEGDMAELLAPLKPAFESAEVGKVGHDLKRLGLLLWRHGIGFRGAAFDTMLASYLSSSSPKNDLASACYEYLHLEPEGKLKPPEARAPARGATTVRRLAQLREVLEERLRERDQVRVFSEIEMPLLPVLLEMELTGVAIDVPALEALSSRLAERIGELETEIYALAGEEFNIASPQQLQRILFQKLQLPPDRRKRTKTGFSTDAEVLAGLGEHEIVARLLEYRELTKLKGTYVDTLPKLVNPRSGRVHTSFNQAVAATGRLSSSDPNLQNIPIRREQGSEIRRAFIAPAGRALLSADYSQIELRVLAHITQDERLMEVFRADQDLHWAAALEIFGVTAAEGTAEMRSFAKTVNFGVTYGISEARLARTMGISVEAARAYVQRYFDRFPRVRDYVQGTPARAAEVGYVTTLVGRRRDLPDLRAKAPTVRQAAERMAVNTPMQGTAADIIKLAMIRVQRELAARGLAAKVVLQVHDELLLEAPEGELEEVRGVVEGCMSTAVELLVPLKVDVKVGPNWLDMAPVTS